MTTTNEEDGNKLNVISHLWDNPAEIPCVVLVEKSLLNCRHVATMLCSTDPTAYLCNALCGGIMSCCGRNCSARCHQCQELNVGQTDRDRAGLLKHREHPCQKSLFCQHRCMLSCSQDHQCTTMCRAACRQACPHAKCKKHCSEPCAPCQEACTW